LKPYRVVQPYGRDKAREATVISEHQIAADAFAEIDQSKEGSSGALYLLGPRNVDGASCDVCAWPVVVRDVSCSTCGSPLKERHTSTVAASVAGVSGRYAAGQMVGITRVRASGTNSALR